MSYPFDELLDLRKFLTEKPRDILNIGVIGSRDGVTRDFAYYHLRHILDICIDNGLTNQKLRIISGGARGADTFGVDFGFDNGFMDPVVFIPDWDQYGKRAGFIRNHTIIENSDIVIAFWDGESKGTDHSIKLAIKAKKIVLVFTPKGTLEMFNMRDVEPRNLF